jgi:transcriptional regulator with XRE-family HTH domain
VPAPRNRGRGFKKEDRVMNNQNCQREYDFALVITGVQELTPEAQDALFSAGCDDATFSIQYGRLYAEFSRTADSLKNAILTAIRDVRKADIGAEVESIDECNLVTQAEIARRINRSRQLVSQYISGERGPGNFPPPACHFAEDAPMWAWCAVSFWLAKNDIIRQEENRNAEIIELINLALEMERQEEKDPELVREITKALEASSA